MSTLHPQRLFPIDPSSRELTSRLYAEVKDLPILSPHGHTDPSWFDANEPFPNPTELFIKPDHYVFRMLYSQGISLQELGIGSEKDAREVWRLFAKNFDLFRGTPSAMWFNHVFSEVFGIEESLSENSADSFYEKIDEKLRTKEFLPRALFDRFKIEVLATTDEATDSLEHHKRIRYEWGKGVIPTFRPDGVVDPEHENFRTQLTMLAEVTGKDTENYSEYISALKERRKFFIEMGATASDHGHADAFTIELSDGEAERLFAKVLSGEFSKLEAKTFRGHMLMKFAEMSLDDGLVMQLHPGSFRNHNEMLFQSHGRDVGADIPQPISYVSDLRPLLNKFGNNSSFSMIVFTLDESTYSRELAPLAGHYPALRIGPPWWFHDSPEGMKRYYESVIETAGFANTAGFNDDTRAFLSIPARHDVFRRMLCRMLAGWVGEYRMTEEDAVDLAREISYDIVKKAYKL